jgi:hypothetical protein
LTPSRHQPFVISRHQFEEFRTTDLSDILAHHPGDAGRFVNDDTIDYLRYQASFELKGNYRKSYIDWIGNRRDEQLDIVKRIYRNPLHIAQMNALAAVIGKHFAEKNIDTNKGAEVEPRRIIHKSQLLKRKDPPPQEVNVRSTKRSKK